MEYGRGLTRTVHMDLAEHPAAFLFAIGNEIPPGVDTPDDLDAVRRILS